MPTTHGMTNTPEFWIWVGMRSRCRKVRQAEYANVKVCARWQGRANGFRNFLADMGPRPTPEHTIGRKDNTGDYCPTNCRWETMAEQNINKSNTVYLTLCGERLPLVVWAKRLKLSAKLLRDRHARGLSDAQVLTMPVQKHRRPSQRSLRRA